MCKQDVFGINKKMKDIETGVSNICAKDKRTLEQNVIIAKATHGIVGINNFTDRYKFLSDLFNAYELATLKKYNIK